MTAFETAIKTDDSSYSQPKSFWSGWGPRLILLALVVLMWLPRVGGPIDLRWDGGAYYVLGTSLAQGKGYKLLNEPGDADATQYPPLLPALIAVHQLISGSSDPYIVGLWLRLTFFLIFVLFIYVVHQFMQLFLPPKYAFWATLLCLFNLHTYFLSDLCFPEIPFGLTTTLFALLIVKRRSAVNEGAGALLAIASYALRTIGIALLAAWVAEGLLNRQYKRSLIRAAIALLIVASWQFYVSSVESSEAYRNPAYAYQRADYMFYNVSYARNISLRDPFATEKGYLTFSTGVKRFVHNALRMPAAIGEAVSIKREIWEMRWLAGEKSKSVERVLSWASFLLLIALGGLSIAGLILLFVQNQRFIPIYVSLYLAAICLTPWPQQFIRYLMPLAPFLVLSLFKILLAFNKSRQRSFFGMNLNRLPITTGVVSLILLQQLIGVGWAYLANLQTVRYRRNEEIVSYRLFFYDESYAGLDRALDWLKGRTRPGEVIASSMPHWVYLRTGLKTVMPPFETDPDLAQRLLDGVPVNYLIIDVGAFDITSYVLPMIRKSPERWQLIYNEPTGRVMIFNRIDDASSKVN